MAKRKDKKTKKFRGLKTHGGGNVKNRRGSGNRGGVGNAGLNKHKKTWTVKFAPRYFGNYGFVNPLREEAKAINIFEIDSMARKGALGRKGDAFAFDFDGKILGAGEITVPVQITAHSWSRKAEEKVKGAGGSMASTLKGKPKPAKPEVKPAEKAEKKSGKPGKPKEAEAAGKAKPAQ